MPRKTPSKQQPKAETGGGKRVTITRDERPLPPDPVEPEELEEQEELSPLESVLVELGDDDFEFAVFRIDPKAPRGRVFAGSLPGSRDTYAILKNLQENFGGGNFELRVREPGGTFSHRVTVAVEAPKVVAPPPAVQMREEMASVLKAATEPMQQLMQQFVQEMRSRPQFNFNTLLEKGVMLLPLLQQVRALIAPGTAPVISNDPLASLQQLAKVRETLDALGLSDREPDAVDRMLAIFNSVGKPLLEKMALQAQRGNGAARTATPSRTPIVAGGAPIVGAPIVPAASVIAAIPEWLEPFVPLIHAAARNGETVESFGERILNALPEDAIDPLADALEDGSLVSALLQKPEFAGQNVWLNALAKFILSDLESGTEEPPEGGADVSGTNGENVTGGADDHQ